MAKKIKIDLLVQSKNNGLAFSVTNAVSSELNKNDGVILLEDDCVPIKGFFDYMYKALKKYRFEKNIIEQYAHILILKLNQIMHFVQLLLLVLIHIL